ncbi:hypothetical protein [Halobacterium wangiae]|uniref:hypothetical protein n=1 Tax=Halobacterium wangiae TaxID=2902623 RepID=UPI001E4B28F5|nr:hypothetical protein [Halobacterium wangiae]
MTDEHQADTPDGEEDDEPSGERSPGEIGPGTTASDPPGADAGESAAAESAPDDGRDEDAPLSDLREDVDERREREDDFDALFDEVSVGDVDEESVWEALSASADDPLFVTESIEDDREVTVVEKRLCHGCEHFADPPHLACNHEGTTIEAEVDTDHFRVVDCPVVAERREEEAGDFSPDDS